MHAQEKTQDPTGERIRHRRIEELRLSQEDLAWLARVSRGTISNLETGRGGPESRTWYDVIASLGWAWRDADQKLPRGEVPESLLAPSVFGKAVRAVIAIRAVDPQRARTVADRFRAFVRELDDYREAQSSTDEELPALTNLSPLASEIIPAMPGVEAAEVIEAFEDLGWSPQDSAPSNPQPADTPATDLQQKLEEIRQELRAVLHGEGLASFNRLPLRVQQALSSGEVVDAEVIRPRGSFSYSVVTMVVRDVDVVPSLGPAERRSMIEVLKQWHGVLDVATSEIVLDLEQLQRLPEHQAGPLARYVATVQSQRGDYNNKALTLGQEDLRALAVLYERSIPELTEQLISWGVLDPESPGLVRNAR